MQLRRVNGLAPAVRSPVDLDRDGKVFVATGTGSDRVAAYYAWCMAQLTIVEAPERLRKGAGRYPQPVALLARIGVAISHTKAMAWERGC